MHDVGDVRLRAVPRRFDLIEKIGHDGGDRLARVARRGERLRHPDAPAGRQHRQAVGEGAADVHRDAEARSHVENPMSRGKTQMKADRSDARQPALGSRFHPRNLRVSAANLTFRY
jgi:hypothetical protein